MDRRAGLFTSLLSAICAFIAPIGEAWASDSRAPRPIYSFEETGLEFGKLAMLAPFGEVQIEPDGRRTISPQLVDLGGQNGPAKLTIYGEPNRPFAILAAKVVWLRNSKHPHRLIVRNVTTSPSQIGTFQPDGTATVYVGGTLKIPGWSRDGEYRGRASVWIKYL